MYIYMYTDRWNISMYAPHDVSTISTYIIVSGNKSFEHMLTVGLGKVGGQLCCTPRAWPVVHRVMEATIFHSVPHVPSLFGLRCAGICLS